jgi:hypothetical protein
MLPVAWWHVETDMPLHLVIHRPVPAEDGDTETARAAVRDAVWEVAESHWPAGAEALVAASDLSSGYLLSHFRRALARRGIDDPGLLIVAPMGEGAAWTGLPAEAQAWMDEAL